MSADTEKKSKLRSSVLLNDTLKHKLCGGQELNQPPLYPMSHFSYESHQLPTSTTNKQLYLLRKHKHLFMDGVSIKKHLTIRHIN